MLAHIDVQVLLGAELVCELLGAEALPIFALLGWIMWADLHFLILDHIWPILRSYSIIIRLLLWVLFLQCSTLIWSFVKLTALSWNFIQSVLLYNNSLYVLKWWYSVFGMLKLRDQSSIYLNVFFFLVYSLFSQTNYVRLVHWIVLKAWEKEEFFPNMIMY